jgi:NAD-dependent SIR2 family protein deacetylase
MAPVMFGKAPTDSIEELRSIVAGRRIAVLTGAGVSTDSGIPDYRGKGASRRTPMNISDFLASEKSRRRYWAGAHVGWTTFSSAQPNAGHIALAAMEQAGHIEGVITQNVDGLHRQAGNAHVVDLHGSLHRVVCLECGQMFERTAVEARISSDNPWLSSIRDAIMAPDGDADVQDYEDLILPECTVCSGVLKPDVVFFGEFVPTKVFAAASNLVKRADVLMVAGSSLAVNSGIRLLEQARKRRLPIVIINRGETKGDRKAAVKIDGSASEVLTELATSLGATHVYEDIE